MAKVAAEVTMPTGAPDAFARAHQQLRADPDIQFDLPRYQPPEIPGWVKWLAEFLEGISPLLKILFWAVVALAVIAILYALFRWLEGQPIRWPWRRAGIIPGRGERVGLGEQGARRPPSPPAQHRGYRRQSAAARPSRAHQPRPGRGAEAAARAAQRIRPDRDGRREEPFRSPPARPAGLERLPGLL